ncbi:hypothetical protein J2W96_005841 [Variovorax guangxiensis]|nr:hypothetical protein [Variovorax guangxiensis]MDR6859504.1 hypothetical protein [Variovorax guangxiensis]
MAACQEAGFVPQEATQISTVVALVGIGLGVALVPQVMQGYLEPRVGYQVIDELQGGNRATAVASAWQPGAESPAITRFLAVHLGDVPESGLDVPNQDGDSVEVALALQLAAADVPPDAGVFGRRIFFPICAPVYSH